MKAIFKTVLSILIICTFLSSCAKTSKRINDLTIVQALAVDSKDSGVSASLQYLNLFENSGSSQEINKSITSVTKSDGKNISDAVFNASKTVSNDIFFGQNKLIVFGFDYSKNNIDSGIEYLLKSNESRPDVTVAIGYPNAEEIIKSKEKGAQIPAQNIYSLIRLGDESGHAIAVTVCDLLNLYNDETSDIYMPVLSTEKDSVKCEGTLVFSRNKPSVFLNEDETLGLLLVKNRFESGIITFDTEKSGEVSVKINSSKAKIKVENIGGKIRFNVNIKAKFTVSETGSTIKNPLTEVDCNAIQKACEEKLEKLCEASVKKCFENESDPFMCARYLYMENMELYNDLKDNWRENLEHIQISVKAKTKMQRVLNNAS
ncbi:MAG: Ger(x)C family spore germination protein [Ruminococcaceae bacterium]|nr:Ger(x)C family spore germination protein [Oscillospiraceae bacterium]